MKDGFIKVATAAPSLRVGDCEYNAEQIIAELEKAKAEKVKLLVFPEMSICGYTVGEVVRNRALLDSAMNALIKIKNATKDGDTVVIVGLPVLYRSALYDCAAVIQRGRVLCVVPKKTVLCQGENYDARFFTPAPEESGTIVIGGEASLFSTGNVVCCHGTYEFNIGIEFGSDLRSVSPVSNTCAIGGANVIACLDASSELIGRAQMRRVLVCSQSARTKTAYLYANAGMGESSSEGVFGGHSIICENGKILAQSRSFAPRLLITEIDVQRLTHDRIMQGGFGTSAKLGPIFTLDDTQTDLTRKISKNPFIPDDACERTQRMTEILEIQANALARRISHVNAKTVVVGISGGLDSCLALLVMAQAMDILGRERNDILAVTMPCFGTTKRTRSNAELICRALNVSFKEINIKKAVSQHFKDIGQDPEKFDVTYENAQARERTQVLMDIANQMGGIVVGTGDLSELALGWATYNGDHMSMYAVNCSIPKTLVRALVRHMADTCGDKKLSAPLYGILDTPVSPELIPPKDGEISQITEDLVGPYELHDFFLYYYVRYGFAPEKILRMAKYAFEGQYADEVIEKWLSTFVRRFAYQQFKRSCSPDGPKVGSVSLIPSAWRMPSDGSPIF